MVRPWTAGKRCRHCCSLAMSASVAWVEMNLTDPTMRPGELGLTGTARRPEAREQVVVTCLAVATDVLLASCTTTHCWPSAASIRAQPLSRIARPTAAHAAGLARVADTGQA